MTVAQGARLSEAGDGTTVEFSPTFRANSAAELNVVVVQDSDGTKTDQVLDTDYTVAFSAGGSAGVPTITFATAPAAGFTVIITPDADYEQETTMANTDPVFGSAFTAALDILAAQVQSLEDQMKTKFGASLDDPFQTVVGDWKDRLDMYAYFNATTGQMEAKALSLIQADLGMLDQDLADIAALTPSDDDFLQRKASEWTNRTPTQVMAELGLLNPDGTVAAPGIAFGSDPDSGYYVIGANEIGHATAGVKDHGVNADGIHVWPKQPSFLALANADILNQTGDGTAYTMIFNTEVYDTNADYDDTTGVFTMPVTGKMDFSIGISLLGFVAPTLMTVELVTSNRTYLLANSIPAFVAATGAGTWNFSVVGADMDAAETASVRITVDGEGSDLIDIDGDAAPQTFFSGRMTQ